MSSDTGARAATRIALSNTRGQVSAIADEPEKYLKESPALVSDTATAAGPRPFAEGRKVKREAMEPPLRQGRARWVLVGWLVVSISTIAIAGIMIAKYF